MGKENTLVLALTLTVSFYIGMLAIFYRVIHANGIKAARFTKKSIKRVAVNFEQDSFSSLNAFEMPMFYVYKNSGYSVSKINVAKFKWQYYSLFYFKNKSSLVGALANFSASDVFQTNVPKPVNGITYYGGEKLKSLSHTAINEALSGKEAFIELSPEGSVFGFKSAATNEIELEEMYTICERMLIEIKRAKSAT